MVLITPERDRPKKIGHILLPIDELVDGELFSEWLDIYVETNDNPNTLAKSADLICGELRVKAQLHLPLPKESPPNDTSPIEHSVPPVDHGEALRPPLSVSMSSQPSVESAISASVSYSESSSDGLTDSSASLPTSLDKMRKKRTSVSFDPEKTEIFGFYNNSSKTPSPTSGKEVEPMIEGTKATKTDTRSFVQIQDQKYQLFSNGHFIHNSRMFQSAAPRERITR